MSIRLELRGITPEAYDLIIAGRHDRPFEWTRQEGGVDKEWAILYRTLIDGSSGFHPGLAAIAVGGGWPIENPEEADYGGAYVLSPDQVAAVVPALAAISDDEFCQRYSSRDYTGLYSAHHGLDDVLYAFHALRRFYAECAEAGDAVLKVLG